MHYIKDSNQRTGLTLTQGNKSNRFLKVLVADHQVLSTAILDRAVRSCFCSTSGNDFRHFLTICLGEEYGVLNNKLVK